MTASNNVGFFLGITFIFYFAPAVAPGLTENIPLHVAASWAIFGFFAVTWKGFLLPLRILTKLEIFALIIPILMMSYYDLVTETDEDYWGIKVYWIFTGIVLAISASAIFMQEKSKNIFIKFSLFAAFATTIISIMQFLNIHPFLWSWTRFSEMGLVYGTAGLDNNTVKFGYSIVGITTIVGCSIVSFNGGVKLLPITNRVFLLVSLVIFLGVLVSGSRSAILGIALGTLWFAWYIIKNKGMATSASSGETNCKPDGKIDLKLISGSHATYSSNSLNISSTRPLIAPTHAKHNLRKIRSTVFLISLLFSAVLLIVAIATRQGVDDDARFSDTWIAYSPVIVANAFGNAIDLNKYIDLMDADSLYNLTSQNRRSEPIWPHNILLTTGLIIGFPGIFSIMVIYLLPILRALKAAKKARIHGMLYEEMWLLALVASNIGVLTHCWYHNANILLGEMRNWIWIGALWGLTFHVTSKLKRI